MTSADRGLPPTVIFLHITKTAGTTVAHLAQRHYAGDRFLRPDHDFAAFRARLERMPDTEKQRIDCLFGHMAFGLHRYLPRPALYATMLRDPVDRVISHYYYAVHASGHPLHRRVIDGKMTFEEYLRSGILEELNDGQVRRLSGLDDGITYGAVPRALLEAAKRNLRDHFAVVGLTERFDASMLLYAKVLGWTTTDYVTLNVTPGRPARHRIPPDLRRLVEGYNTLDAELYAYARDLLQEQLTRHQITRAAIARFRVRHGYRTVRRRIVRALSAGSRLAKALVRARRHGSAGG